MYNLHTYSHIDATGSMYKSYSTAPPILVDGFHCNGSERHLRDCQYTETAFANISLEYHGEATVYCICKYVFDVGNISL